MFLSALVLAAASGLAAPVDAYRAALATMRALPSPAYVTYRTDLESGDATIALSLLADGRVKPRVVMGAGLYDAKSWEVAYRAADGLASIATGDGRHALSSLALFDPTWNGISVWMRRGLAGTLERDAAPAADAGASAKEPATIATVYAFDPSAYRVEDAGVAWCGADPGRLLRMTALRDPARHPLQRVAIDAVDGRICTVRLAISGSEGADRFDGYVELQLGEAAGSYLVRAGYLDVGASERGERIGWAHVRFRYDEPRAAAALPDDLFAP